MTNEKDQAVQHIKDNTSDYKMFETIIIEGLARRDEVANATEKQIRNGIDEYLWDLYLQFGIQRVDAWDERHRENAPYFIEQSEK